MNKNHNHQIDINKIQIKNKHRNKQGPKKVQLSHFHLVVLQIYQIKRLKINYRQSAF